MTRTQKRGERNGSRSGRQKEKELGAHLCLQLLSLTRFLVLSSFLFVPPIPLLSCANAILNLHLRRDCLLLLILLCLISCSQLTAFLLSLLRSEPWDTWNTEVGNECDSGQQRESHLRMSLIFRRIFYCCLIVGDACDARQGKKKKSQCHRLRRAGIPVVCQSEDEETC